MRASTKKELLSLLGALEKAEGPLMHLCKQNQKNQINRLLEDMQNSAIALGETIEDGEGEGTETVHLLEEYCELLWQCMTTPIPWRKEKMCGEIRRCRRHICRKLDEEFPVSYEVLFMPCKASMWKSMESLWRDMEEWESCECNVAPVPYLEQDSSEEHFEGEQFPDDVPVTYYEDYELGSLMLDVIVIGGSCSGEASCVPIPGYQGGDLKQFAEMLVYLPHFEKEEDFEGILVNQELLFADRVIVPSESIRQACIEAVLAWTDQHPEEEPADRKVLEQKIRVLSLPRMNDVIDH